MNQQIVGFHLDELGDWVADLDCGHGQHVRHNPPWTNRPWVVSEFGRSSFIGKCLNCLKCDRGESVGERSDLVSSERGN